MELVQWQRFNQNRAAFDYRTPRYFLARLNIRLVVARPVSGLVRLDFAPSQALSSVAGCKIKCKLTYRCGGSIGLIKLTLTHLFPSFTSLLEKQQGT